jgi:hypothetical protein
MIQMMINKTRELAFSCNRPDRVSLVTDQPRCDLSDLVTDQPRPRQPAKEVV